MARGDTAAEARLRARGPEMARRKGRRTQNLAMEAGWLVATYLEDLERSDTLVRFATGTDLEPTVRASAHYLLGNLAVAGGRWSAAREEYATSARLGAIDSALLGLAMAAALPFLGAPSEEVRAVRAQVEQWDPGSEGGIPLPGPARPLGAHLRHYLLGLLSARLGEQSAALRHADALQGLPAPPDAGPLTRALSRTVRADAALGAGRVDEASRLLEDGTSGDIPLELIRLPYFSGEYARYLRGVVLHRAGRDEDGLALLAHALSGTPGELHYRGPVHLLRAQMLQRLDRRKQAAEEYSRFIGLYQRCDPTLHPVLDRARSELALMIAEPR